MPIKRMQLKPQNGRGKDDQFPYLLFKRPDEKISRVDKYSIVLYWSDYDHNGNPVMKSELLFYPSEYGMNEIRKYAEGESLIESSQTKGLIHRLDQLMRYGNPWWRYDTTVKLTPEMWILNENIKTDMAATYQQYGYTPDIDNPPEERSIAKRLKLKAKPARMKLKSK